MRVEAFSELPLHEQSARNWIRAVGPDLSEPERAVERHRRLHPGDGVEPHAPIAADTRLREYGLGEQLPEPAPPVRRPHVEPLHLARLVRERAERHAAGDPGIVLREQDGAARGRVVARQRGNLSVEVLEGEIEAERRGVLLEKPPRLNPIVFGRGRADHSHWGAPYRIRLNSVGTDAVQWISARLAPACFRSVSISPSTRSLPVRIAVAASVFRSKISLHSENGARSAKPASGCAGPGTNSAPSHRPAWSFRNR